MSFTLAAPAPFFAVQAQSGTQYTGDRNGVITGVAANDMGSLLNAGCVVPSFVGRLLNADMNATTDQLFTLINSTLPYRITRISFADTGGVSLTTAQGGIYPAASKGGTAIVANTQAFTTATGATIVFDLTIVSGQQNILRAAGLVPILSLTTAQGAAAAGDFYLYGDFYG
jgi:hypothetical protein